MRHNDSEPDDIRQLLAEQDLLDGPRTPLRGPLADDPFAARDNGTAELKAIMRNYKEPERTFSEAAAAQWLGITPQSLARRRRRGTGPEVQRTWDGTPRYTFGALGAWLADHQPTPRHHG